jgi:hypothetical protein
VAVPRGEKDRMSERPKRTGSPDRRPRSGGGAGTPGFATQRGLSLVRLFH